MNTKMIEGLVGASNNMSLTNVPMKVFNEARLKGEVDVMDRSMKYVGKSIQKVKEYSETTDAGMKEEVENAREKKKLEDEKALEALNSTSLDKSEKAKVSGVNEDVLELSEEGRAILEEKLSPRPKGMDNNSEKPLIYTKAGEVGKADYSPVISISV